MKDTFEKIIKMLLFSLVMTFVVILVWAVIISMLKVMNENLSGVELTMIATLFSGVISLLTFLINKNYEQRQKLIIEKIHLNQEKFDQLLGELIKCKTKEDKNRIYTNFNLFVISRCGNRTLALFNKFIESESFDNKKIINSLRNELGLNLNKFL